MRDEGHEGHPFFVTHFKGQPAEVIVACPSCGQAARFDAAFLASTMPPKDGPADSIINWAGRYILERYPDQVGWDDPANTASKVTAPKPGLMPGTGDRNVLGVINCPICGLRRRHLLRWPDDAYYRCDIRGEMLWAWNRAHLVALRNFIAGDARDTGKAAVPLGDLPAHFLLAKHRPAALHAIDRCLRER